MKTILVAIFALSLSLTLAAQTPATASTVASVTASASTPASSTTPASASKATPAPAPAPAKPADLATTLTDAETAVTATNTDLAALHTEKWSSGWKTGWKKKGSQKQQASQTADSLKQLTATLPGMITDVRTAHGSVGSAFKLYNSVTQVCEDLDSLVEATQNYGKKDEYTRLSADYANLLRIRSGLSSYVEQRAAVVDPRGNVPSSSTASAARKDEAAPAKKTVAKHVARYKKKTVAHSSN